MEFVYEKIDTTDLDTMINYLREEIGEHSHRPAYQLLNRQLDEVMRVKTERMLSRKVRIILTEKEYEVYMVYIEV